MKKPVIRTCIACRTAKDKKEMLRIVRDTDGNIKLDFTGKASGRGAYICDAPTFIENCVRQKLSGRVLDAPVSDEVYKYIAEEYAKSKN